MASVALDDFLPDLLPDLPGVPHPTAINALRNATIEFCTDSCWINETMDPQPVEVGVAEYYVDAPPESRVVAVLSVVLDGRLLPAFGSDTATPVDPAGPSRSGHVSYFLQPVENVIRLVSTPEVPGQMIISAAYAPTRRATRVDRRIFDYHLDTIIAGATWRLKSMTGQPWSDLQGAHNALVRFRNGVGKAIIARNRGNTRAPLSVAMRPFA